MFEKWYFAPYNFPLHNRAILSELFLRVAEIIWTSEFHEKEKKRKRERRIGNSVRLAYALISLEHQLEPSRKRYT